MELTIVRQWENTVDSDAHPGQLHRSLSNGRTQVRYWGEWKPCDKRSCLLQEVRSVNQQGKA